MLLLHRARQQPDGGRSPAAAGGESRRCLLCPAAAGGESRRCLLCPDAAGAGCAPNPHPAGAL